MNDYSYGTVEDGYVIYLNGTKLEAWQVQDLLNKYEQTATAVFDAIRPLAIEAGLVKAA